MAKAKTKRAPRKARAEGALAKPAVAAIEDDKFAPDPPRDEEPFEQPSDFESKTEEEIVGKLGNPVPGDDGDALDRIVASFRERFPAEWDGIALCATQHGVTIMAGLLRGRG